MLSSIEIFQPHLDIIHLKPATENLHLILLPNRAAVVTVFFSYKTEYKCY